MSIRRSTVAAVVVLLLPLIGSSRAAAADPGECTKTDPITGYCIEWSVGGHNGTPGGSGSGGGPAPVCYWLNIPPINDDPAIFADFDLALPPPGAVLQWQSWECSDGRVTFNFRWVFSVPPEDLAWGVRVRITGQLVQPVVEVSPPLGTPSIITVPVFVAVANWSGVITDSACGGGLCATVTATPTLVFATGEPGAKAIACSGSGSRFNRSTSPTTQASAPGACARAYLQRTGVAGRPVEWPGSVSVTWTIAWTSTVGQSGQLPSITRTAPLPRAVREVQTVVVGGLNP